MVSIHLRRIRSGAYQSFSSSLQELDINHRIEVMLDLVLLDTKLDAFRSANERIAPAAITALSRATDCCASRA
ncbi:MAG TPA: hypothetical protein V6D17_19380 [Candidatus Obscuribacterales bacterium]